jgi:hypothetical protein
MLTIQIPPRGLIIVNFVHFRGLLNVHKAHLRLGRQNWEQLVIPMINTKRSTIKKALVTRVAAKMDYYKAAT